MDQRRENPTRDGLHRLFDQRHPAQSGRDVLRVLASRNLTPGRQNGRDAFYTGEIADDMITILKSLGGLHTHEDFAQVAYTPTAPVAGSYKDIDVMEHPPNGQSTTALLMLNVLSHFDIAGTAPWDAERAHIEAEVAKPAYDARNRFVADADFATRADIITAP